MTKFILILQGPMCAGKSTIANLVLQKEKVFHAAYDKTKWLVGNYSAQNTEHTQLTKELVFKSAQTAVDFGFSVVVNPGFKDYREKYKELAKEFGYRYISVNIETSKEILEKRFLERVESAKQTNAKNISVTTLDGFQLRYNDYFDKHKDSEAETFDSSLLSPEEIFTEIEKQISS